MSLEKDPSVIDIRAQSRTVVLNSLTRILIGSKQESEEALSKVWEQFKKYPSAFHTKEDQIGLKLFECQAAAKLERPDIAIEKGIALIKLDPQYTEFVSTKIVESFPKKNFLPSKLGDLFSNALRETNQIVQQALLVAALQVGLKHPDALGSYIRGALNTGMLDGLKLLKNENYITPLLTAVDDALIRKDAGPLCRSL